MGEGKLDMRPEWAFYAFLNPKVSLSENWICRAASQKLRGPWLPQHTLGPRRYENATLGFSVSKWHLALCSTQQANRAKTLTISPSLPRAWSQQEPKAWCQLCPSDFCEPLFCEPAVTWGGRAWFHPV